MQNVSERMSLDLFDHRMHMVGHDGPCYEPVALSVEMFQRIANN